MKKSVVLSGIQPTGNIHVGNYLGALKNWVDLQNSKQYACFFSIVDYHSLSGNMTAEARRAQIQRTVIELLSLGIDPEKSTLFVQSSVPEITELSWIFNTVTPIAELERMTQYKDKSVHQEQNVNAGLFTYPVLQAADILSVHGTKIPVGEDQLQHIELTRLIARNFNRRYGAYFTEPEALLTKTLRVKSLLAPEKKMSKSLGEGHVIELCDDPATIEKKLKKAVTASEGGGAGPGVENLFTLLEAFGDTDTYNEFRAAEEEGAIRYGDLKSEIGTAIAERFTEFRERRKELEAHPRKVAQALQPGIEKARKRVHETLAEVRDSIGLPPLPKK